MARLAIEDLSVAFGGVHALRSVSFAVETGSIVGLIGPNGAGKSTLLNCVSGITRPTAGRTTLDGTVLSTLPAARIARRGIGRVFQHPELVRDLTARENLLIACHSTMSYGLISECLMTPGARRQERMAEQNVSSLLAELGLSGIAGKRVRDLPYGHQKLVDLGRALLMEINFLLLDEPIAGLNDEEIAALGDLILALRLKHDLGVIIVEHNMAFVSRLCDRLIALDLGAIIAEGSAAEVLSHPRVQVAYLGEAVHA
ncbi:MAG TPA: ABC transporter ATP-binding protein [Roseiarcus sp.]